MKKLIICAFLAAGFAAQANASSYIDNRGYNACEDRLQKEFHGEGATFSRTYYVERGAEARKFYINAHVWANDTRSPVTATCTTTPNGREVTSIETIRGGAYTLEDGALAIR